MSGTLTVPIEVLQAFGATETPVQLPGGQGQSFRCGSLVLKPAADDEETNWIAWFYLAAPRDGFRLPVPVRSRSGDLVYHGWQAWEALEGQAESGRWLETIGLCQRFHRAIAHLPRPAYFDRRPQIPWVVADQVAWDECLYEHHPRIAPVVEQLRRVLHPMDVTNQLIHGDFGGNVLFSDGPPPAIIDFSPYWRPLEFAVGVVVADAIVWEGAGLDLIEAGSQFRDFDQYLARAELRRIIELDTLNRFYAWDILDEIEAHLPLVRAIIERSKSPAS
jgi:uncharacterized protein (TIGR02569 family)